MLLTYINILRRIIRRPWYAALLLGSTLLVSMILIWFFNLQLILHVIGGSVLSAGDKILFFFETVATIYADALTSLRSFLFVAFSLLFGLNITVLAFLKRYRLHHTTPKGSLAAALVGSGCVACGGSILAPVLVLTGATATVTLSHTINILAFVLATGLAGYSLSMLLARNREAISRL